MDILEKLEVLGAAAKYDVSCASSGSKRENILELAQRFLQVFATAGQMMGVVFLF